MLALENPERRKEERNGADGHDEVAEKNARNGKGSFFDLEVIGCDGKAGNSHRTERCALQRLKAGGFSAKKNGKRNAQGYRVQLDKAVGPHAGLPGVADGEVPAGEVRRSEHDGCGPEQAALAQAAHRGRPDDVELLLDGEAPEGKDHR